MRLCRIFGPFRIVLGGMAFFIPVFGIGICYFMVSWQSTHTPLIILFGDKNQHPKLDTYIPHLKVALANRL